MIEIADRLGSAEVRKVRNSTSDVVRHIVSTMSAPVLEKLASKPKRVSSASGKGGSTNYAESVLVPEFLKLGVRNTVAHPNGSQQPPDILLGGKHEIELKSVRRLSVKFAFNDSLPKPWVHYCLYAREEKRALALRGDILLLSLDSDLVTKVCEKVSKVRSLGMTKKGEGLAYFYTRQGLFIRNFLYAAPANGYYDFDSNILWVPK